MCARVRTDETANPLPRTSSPNTACAQSRWGHNVVAGFDAKFRNLALGDRTMAELGWLHITLRRRADRGRPVRLAELSDEKDTRLPRPRRQIEPEISGRHRLFAMRAVYECCPGGGRSFGTTIPPVVEAYLRTYPSTRSRAAARASASRLMRHPHVRAVMQWFYARLSREIPGEEPMPNTASGIWARLAELGNWRVKHIR